MLRRVITTFTAFAVTGALLGFVLLDAYRRTVTPERAILRVEYVK